MVHFLLVFVAFLLMVGIKPQAAFALSSPDHPQRIALVTGSNKGKIFLRLLVLII
jgi:hypothetical protein